MNSDLWIIHCDDDDILRRHCKEIIKENFPEVNLIQCENGILVIEQLKKLEEKKLALIISDLHMKCENGDGKSLYNYIKKNGIDCPFLLITGDATQKFEEFQNDEKFYSAYKPFDSETLVSMIAKLSPSIKRNRNGTR